MNPDREKFSLETDFRAFFHKKGYVILVLRVILVVKVKYMRESVSMYSMLQPYYVTSPST